MDEKESVPENPIKSVSGTTEDTTTINDASTTLDQVEPVNKDGPSDLISGTDSNSEFENKNSDIQNHVDHDTINSDTENDPAKSEILKESESSHKESSVANVSTNDDDTEKPEQQSQQELEQSNDIKDEVSESQNSTEVGLSQTSEDVDENKITFEKREEDDEEEGRKDEDVGKPEFETAPNVSMDDMQEDHTQALDPFDALLKDRSESNVDIETATTSQAEASNVNDDDEEDDHNVDNVEADEEDTPAEGQAEEPGADEEVCLLPDTEREISEADKAEAEKVLAEKRKQSEVAQAVEDTVPKTEVDASDVDGPCRDDGVNNEHTEVETPVAEETTQENGDDKENDVNESLEPEEIAVQNNILEIAPFSTLCTQCFVEKPCKNKFTAEDGEDKYLCSDKCTYEFMAKHPGEFAIVSMKFKMVEEIIPRLTTCSECEEKKICYFYYKLDGERTFYCSLQCLYGMMADERDQYCFKRRKIVVDTIEPKEMDCSVCNQLQSCQYSLMRYGEQFYVCNNECMKALNLNENGRYVIMRNRNPRKTLATSTPNTSQPIVTNPPLLKLKVISNATDRYLDEAYKIQAKTPAMVQAARDERERTFIRRCYKCAAVLQGDEKILTWETMDFCDEVCLGWYQNKIGSRCANCQKAVQHTSLGKYCVRFGYDIRQFCNSACLEEFKKGLKICCYCQRDISVGHQGFLAPVGDKGQFKDFCSQMCMEKFDQMSKNPIPSPVWAKCAVCSLEKATTIEVEVSEDVSQRLCSDPCFAAFKFVNNIFPDQCRWCKKYFERKQSKCFTIYDGNNPQCFCSKSCINVFISNSRQIMPCNWCKVKKYNFDMIKRTQSNGQALMMCSLNCLNLYKVSVNAVSSRRTKCDMCKRTSLAQYHLTMSDATVRNFCTYQCVMSFQGQYSNHAPPLLPGEQIEQPKAVPTGAPRRTYANTNKNNAKTQRSTLPVISNVQSLAAPPPLTPSVTRAKSKRLAQPPPEPEPPAAPLTPPPPPKPPTPPPPPPPKIYNHVIVKTLPPKEVANKATMSKPQMVSKGVSCRPHPCTKECQTDPSLERRVLIPVPVPIYVPVPCAMWSLPFPVPVPIPLPIPTPVFIPTTRNSAKGIMKEINKIHDKMPTDPFEAELLMMAEMVAGDKKKDQSDSDTDDDNGEETFSPVAGMDGNNAFGEDMLQMALKMATEYEDQPVDLESAMTANTITPSSHPGMPGEFGSDSLHHHHMMVMEQQRAVAALRASGGAAAAAAPANARNKRAVPPPRPARASKRRRAEPAPPPPRAPARAREIFYTPTCVLRFVGYLYDYEVDAVEKTSLIYLRQNDYFHQPR
ncbi:hypothetical protein ACJJTC_016961 [Scirpophaga incertulas]